MKKQDVLQEVQAGHHVVILAKLPWGRGFQVFQLGYNKALQRRVSPRSENRMFRDRQKAELYFAYLVECCNQYDMTY